MSEGKKTILNPAVVMEQTNEEHLTISVDSGDASVVISLIGPKERITDIMEQRDELAQSLVALYRFLATVKV